MAEISYPETSSSSEKFLATPQERLDELEVFPPLPPTHLMADVSVDGSATITWTPPYVPPGGNAQSIDYTWKLVGGDGGIDGDSIPFDAISVDLVGLDINIPYIFTLQANDIYGSSFPASVEFMANAVGPHAVYSFSPTSGRPGSTFTIEGIGFSGATIVTINGISCTLVINSDTEIVATVSNDATSGLVGVTSTAGTSTSDDVFTVIPTPPAIVISSFSPTSGYGGDTILIEGSGFTSATSVAIHGVAVSSFAINSDTEISAVVSTSNTTGKITVTGPGGTTTSADTFTVNVLTGPTISYFRPLSGEPGSGIMITGTNFTYTTRVLLNGDPVDSFFINSDTQITAIISDTNTSGTITITAIGSVTSDDSFTVTPITMNLAPTITSVTPTSGVTGDYVVLTGSGFLTATAIKLNGVDIGAFVDSDSQISLNITYLSTSGYFSVTNPYGTGTSATMFTVIPSPPVIADFIPTSAPTGSHVTLQGSGFYGATAVLLNDVAVASFNVTMGLDSEITLVLSGSNTSGKFKVTTPNGTATSTDNFTITTPVSVPTITSFTPTSGRSATNVIITGTGFTGVTSVLLNGADIGGHTVNSDTQITKRIAVTDTTGHFTVIKPSGSVVSSGTFTALPSVPIITSFTPVQGSDGTQATLTGQGFEEASAVFLNGTNVANFVPGAHSNPPDTSMAVTISPQNTTGKFSVTNADGTGYSSSTFTVLPTAPSISSFTPTSGASGTVITITGVRFTGTTEVAIDVPGVSVVPLSFTVNSDTQITATTSSSNAYSGQIYILTSRGATLSTGTFTVTGSAAKPAITSFSPSSGQPGTSVVINGTGFTGTTSLKLNGADRGGWTVNSDSKITKTIASNDSTGKFTVVKPAGTVDSTGSFTVVTPPPNITSFSPTSGSTGTSVTINGSAFNGATNVKLGGTNVASFSVLSNIQIRATTSSSNTTGKFVVTTPYGSDTSSGTFTVAVPAPVITSFSPTGGPSGTVFIITGSHFTGATAVKIGSKNVLTFTVTSDTSIHATVASSNTTGLVSVVTPAGTDVSSSNFTVTTGGGGGGGL